MKLNRLEVFLECALLYSCCCASCGWQFWCFVYCKELWMIQKQVMMRHLTLLSRIMSC